MRYAECSGNLITAVVMRCRTLSVGHAQVQPMSHNLLMRHDVKICSLLPSGTEIVFALGLGDQLVGVSDLCDYPAAARHKPVVSRSLVDTTVLSSTEVEAKMRALRTAAASPFHIEAAVLRQEAPDLVQHGCLDVKDRK